MQEEQSVPVPPPPPPEKPPVDPTLQGVPGEYQQFKGGSADLILRGDLNAQANQINQQDDGAGQ